MDISHIPNQPGVYFFKTKNDDILYIGKANDLKKRISQYFNLNSVWKQDMLAKAHKIDFMIVKSESEALLLENNLIKKYQPPYNALLKGGTRYVYVKITKEDFPQIMLTRYRTNDGAIYIGPKHMKKELKKLVQLIRQFLQFRGCKSTLFKKGVLCSDYSFNICKGWCVYAQMQKNMNVKTQQRLEKLGFQKEYTYEQAKQEYEKIISYIIDFFQGKNDTLHKQILWEINKAVKKQNFERAVNLRDIYQNILHLTESQTVEVSKPITGRFYQIRRIGDYYIYIILNFYEGKLIDILRFKEKQADTDFEKLIAEFEAEFGDFKKYHISNHKQAGLSKKIGRISKKLYEEIDDMMSGFLDSFIISSAYEKENLIDEILKKIQQKYELKSYPYIVESIDISHMSGEWVSGGLANFTGGIPNKHGYRRFKIKAKDDYASLTELLNRRLLRPNKKIAENLPDLLLIDGGKGQLNILKKLLTQDKRWEKIIQKVDFLALGKGKSRTRKGKLSGQKEIIYKFNKDFTIKEQEMEYDDADRLLVKIRDEAHRFANKYRQTQMSKFTK